MKKNDEFVSETLSLGSNGEGVIKFDGITYFVPGCLPGEKVRVKTLKIKGNIGYGKLAGDNISCFKQGYAALRDSG